MLSATDLNKAIAQLVIFTPDASAFSAPQALALILGKYSHLYNGNVQALPLPEEIPQEVPRVILQSKDGTHRLDLSPLRVTSYWMRSAETLVEPEDILSTSIEVLEHYVEGMEAQVGRLALVLTWIYKAENPAKLIVERFCKPELQTTIFNESENFEIHNHKHVNLKNFSVNSWMRCKTGLLIMNNVESKGVIVEQDVNTLIEEIQQHRFTSEEIKTYFKIAAAEAEANLQVYFPEDI
ncbi:MAG: hypothetical protein KME28_11045 [Pelatocladus maniniholoensis HA4357-MV3]|jgi:hypothetical protein|uniref:Uncharacterized protein n=1 Tax=Pelatocladus maniniholoensis HA4357-MV3 TaxID=1117104 RepID=A0A9E3H7L1_9NOST|nr:hypothetical protein [Pelatocladus maniniholoensis HA4357-MV3]